MAHHRRSDGATSDQACARLREAISARHDGEALPSGITPDGLRHHLGACPRCSAFAAALSPLSARTSAASAEAPLLGATVLTALAEDRATRSTRPTVAQLRWLVGLVGGAQLILALPVVLGVLGPGLHAGRELGSLQLALGVGLVFAALQPRRVAGVLPVLAAVTAMTVILAAVDVATGVTSFAAELVHLSELVGLVAAWTLARRTPLAPVLPAWPVAAP